MAGPREFTCTYCGTKVASFGEAHANDQDICAQCLWLLSIEDLEEREKLRRFLEARR
jgi:hypothetical protein